jgi:hypothetical protein
MHVEMAVAREIEKDRFGRSFGFAANASSTAALMACVDSGVGTTPSERASATPAAKQSIWP